MSFVTSSLFYRLVKYLEGKRLGIVVDGTWYGKLLNANISVLLGRSQVELQVMCWMLWECMQ